MESKVFLDYIKLNLKRLYVNFNSIFNINFEEFSTIIKKIIYDVSEIEFYKKMLFQDKLATSFNKDSLLKIKNYLLSLQLDEGSIKKIILSAPQILLYANQIEKIYLIYRNAIVKGVVLVDENEYKSYSFLNNSKYTIEGYDTNSYDYLVEEMLSSLEREDIKQSLDFVLDKDTKLSDKMNALTRSYSKKNYHFKR